MKKQLATAGVCALALAGVSAGSASANEIIGNSYASVQLFDATGLVKTVDCTTSRSAMECQGDVLAIEREVHAPFGTPTDVIGAFRTLDANGKPLVVFANNDASMAVIDRFDATGATASAANGGASAAAKHHKKAAKHAKKHKKAAKK